MAKTKFTYTISCPEFPSVAAGKLYTSIRAAKSSASYHSISAPPRRAYVVCVQTGETVARYYDGKRMATKTMTVSEVIANA